MQVRPGALATGVLLSAACGVLSPEEQLLTRFFEASRLHDTTRASTMSAVTFNPRTDGVVRAFDIAAVSGDGQTEALAVDASIARPDGALVQRRLTVTLQRRDGRWFIAAME